MFSERLERLIEASLQDGQLTEQEKSALVRRAEIEGVDLSELEIYINSIIQKRQQEKHKRIEQETAESEKERRGGTCPYCGSVIPPLTRICPGCGRTIIANTKADKALEALYEELEKAIEELKTTRGCSWTLRNNFKQNKAEVERLVRNAKQLYSDNEKVAKFCLDIEKEIERSEANLIEEEKRLKKEEFIESTAEAIFEHKIISIPLFIAIIWGLCSLCSAIKGPDVKDDPKATTEAISKAIQEGDLGKAEEYFNAYREEHGTREIKPISVALAKALIESGDLSAAEGLLRDRRYINDDDINWRIQEEFIKVGDYQRAEACVDWTREQFMGDHYYRFLCKCIDQMKENGDPKNAIKSFIDRTTVRYNDYKTSDKMWQMSAVKKRLQEYAGL